ncbi:MULTISPECIES: hypothetical protein [Pseudoalteromonas]|uniref:hypothetical protein n=1 Tax=Pseudoalteromonas TaxID=53246 RepID=UPI0002CBBF6B|nr:MULTISPECIES: hypothetical protein [Pseudoalteromonas]ENN99816.1 hypothetical protein J139_04405 [Pseudoalteromonas agarivorans S816]TMS68375.1 hypothetical protein CWB86_12690 [Pseudoalteromonas sp. S1731]TMS69593.1 hypothetical protein CWB83_02930 [Pseudoalteromonas sp. S1691]TMS73446.1 hypothetical protein CWB88_11730 [Pseudoalteromonas sp. S1941]TMS76355.1 hypothetical protein CWB82_17050 [Pseudoalteromonas sp. S1690]
MAAYTAGQVSISNGSKAVVINSDENPESVAKGDFLFLSGSDPKEINRTYINDQQKHVIELIENWDSGNKTNQPAIVLPTTVEFRDTVAAIKNANLLINDNMQAMSDWQSKLGTVTFIGLDGTERTVPTLASFLATLGTAATKDVTTSPTDTTAGRLLKVGDFGISGTATPPFSDTLNYDSDEVYSGVHRITNSSQITLPEGVSDFGILDVSRYGRSELVQAYTPILQNRRLFRRIQGDIVGDWVEMYHSGNSVNPLDYGLGSATALAITDYNELAKSGFFAAPNGTNSAPKGGNFGGIRVSTSNPNNGFELACNTTSSDSDAAIYFRGEGGGVYHQWKELFHSGSTNFTTLKGEKAGDQLGAIAFRNSSSLFMVKDLSGYTSAPSSITCTGTFKVTNQAGVDLITGIPASDLFLDVLTSNKRLKIKILNVDPAVLSFGGDQTYELSAETDGSDIEVNP